MDRRAKALAGEYMRDLAALRRFHNTVAGQAGPLERRLEELVGETGLQGLVVGRWGEASQDLHNLVQGLADARALYGARLTGITTSEGNLSTIVSRYRRILSWRLPLGKQILFSVWNGPSGRGCKRSCSKEKGDC